MRMRSSSGLGRNFAYLNTRNKFYPIGIGFGGQVGTFRLWIGDGEDGERVSLLFCRSLDSLRSLLFPSGISSCYTVHTVKLLHAKTACVVFAELKGCYFTKSDCTFGAGELVDAVPPSASAGAVSGPAKTEKAEGDADQPKEATSSSAAAEDGEAATAEGFLRELRVKELEVWGAGDGRTLDRQRVLMKQQEQVRPSRLARTGGALSAAAAQSSRLSSS